MECSVSTESVSAIRASPQTRQSTWWNSNARSTRCQRSQSRIDTRRPNRSQRHPCRRHSVSPRRNPRLTYRLRVTKVTRAGWSSASSPRTTARSSSRLGPVPGSTSSATIRSLPSTSSRTNRHRMATWPSLVRLGAVSEKRKKWGRVSNHIAGRSKMTGIQKGGVPHPGGLQTLRSNSSQLTSGNLNCHQLANFIGKVDVAPPIYHSRDCYFLHIFCGCHPRQPEFNPEIPVGCDGPCSYPFPETHHWMLLELELSR